MIFQGDLSKYHPADALMFLSQLSLDGVLSVAHSEKVLTLGFQRGFLMDAQSSAGDEKLLRMLRFHGRIDGAAEDRIRRIRLETGMAVRQILGELGLFGLVEIRDILEAGIQEVLLELFLLDNGTFHFTDTPMDPDQAGIQLDTGVLSLKTLAQADDWRNFEKSIVTLDRGVGSRVPSDRGNGLPPPVRAVTRLAFKPLPLRRLLRLAPMNSHAALRIVENQLGENGLFLLPVPDDRAGDAHSAEACVDPLFAAYKQALKSLIRTGEVLKKVEAVVAFCKQYYTGILIMTARDRRVVHCKAIAISTGGGIRQKSIKEDLGTIDQDPVFDAVLRSGIGFFGQPFPSPLIGRVITPPAAGECALLPILDQPPLAMFFFAYSEAPRTGLSPHHYLELLSWMITPGSKPGAAAAAAATARPSDMSADGASDAGAPDTQAMTRMVDQLEELPPLPALAARTLELLADPETPIDEVARTIAQDQALVGKIIKVSNSALYGGLQKVETLRQALARLGAKTTKSLILAASTRSYFFKAHKGMRTWGQYLWQHSLECGLAARRVAVASGRADPETAFVAGIMHDIGKLAILLLDPEKFKAVQQLKSEAVLSDPDAETRVLGVDHTVLGHRLMEKWRLPEPVARCVLRHHQWNNGDGNDEGMPAAVVAYANHLSHALGSRPSPPAPGDAVAAHALCRALGLGDAALAELEKTVRADFQTTDLLG